MKFFDFKKELKLLFALFVCLLAGKTLSAQTNTLDNIVSSIVSYNQQHIEEKIYLHTDRSYYLCSDILWFKAYIEDAKNNEPLSLSKVAYVELLNASHDPVLQAKINIVNGNGSGSFVLPSSLASGNYELRAYTNWMKNDSAFHFFRKALTIVNTTKNLDLSLVNRPPKYFAQFFPEGGNLVNGIKSLVAFKVNDNSGKGIDAEGLIVDQTNDTIAHFQTTKFGMGNLYFTPEAGKNYRAIITLKDSTNITKALPVAFDKGYVMHVADGGNTLNISVTATGEPSTGLYLIAETNRSIDFSQQLQLNNGNAVFSINKNIFKDGVAEITLFNENRQPLCERLFFKRPQNKLVINAKTDKQTYTKRNQVNIEIATSNEAEKLLQGNLSASVYRLDGLHQPQEGNIFTYLWLASDLKGFIEDPEYYFNNDNAATSEALDNLLLTQGWRAFNWDNIFSHPASFIYVPENQSHIITGKITNEATGKPVSDVVVYLSVPGRRVQLYGCKSNADGLVHFEMKDFYGPSQIVLQTDTKKDSIYHLQIFSPYSEEFSNVALPALTVSESNRESLEDENLHMEISNAYHASQREKLAAMAIDTLPFYYKPYNTYLLDNYTRFTTMEEVLREYVLELNVTRRDKNYHIKTFNAPGYALLNQQPSQRMFDKDPLVLLDGVPVFDINKIIAYDPLKVQKLEIVASRYIWGPIVADGIASFTTYKGDLPGYSLNPHDVILDYDGLQKQRIFYSPNYSTEKAVQSRIPDFRDVLYWSPDVNTDTNGKGKISFYTGDIPGKYLVEVQGMSANGDAGSTSIIFDVVK